MLDNSPPAAVPLLTRDPSGLSVTYLSAALESAAGYRVERLIPGDFDHRILSRYRWLVIDDVGIVDAELEASLQAFMEDGGSVLAFAGDRAAGLERIPLSGHQQQPAGGLAPAGEFMSIGSIDTAHPALSRTEGWQSVHVSRSLPLDELAEDEVLIRLDNNDPLLMERRVGAGRFLFAPTALDNRWSDLPVRPVFVSFVIEAAAYLRGATDISRSFSAGDTLPLTAAGSASGQVVDPDGNTILSLADTTREQQIKLNKPGFYEVYTPQGQTTIAANVDARESALAKITQEVLDRWQDAAVLQPAATGSAIVETAEERREFWHWLLLLLVVIVIGESVLGNMHLTLRRVERA